jgi:ATP-binding cassette, subfamily B, multidrug efflux pump
MKGIYMKSRGIAKDEIEIQNNDFSGLKSIIMFGKDHFGQLSIFITVLVLASIMLMASSYIMGLMVQAISQYGGGDTENGIQLVIKYACLFLAFEIASFLLKWYGSLGMIRTSVEIILSLRFRIFSKLTLLPLGYFDTQPLGRTITRATGDVQGIESLFSRSLFSILRSLIQIIVVLGAMLILSPKLGAFVVLSAAPAVFLNLFIKKWTRKWMREMKRQGSRVNSKMAENLNGLAVIKAFGLEGWSRDKLQKLLNDQLKAHLTLNNINSFIRPMTVFLSSFPNLVTIILGGSFVLNGNLDLAIYIAFIRYTEMFLMPVRTISYEIQQIQDAFSSAERVNKLLNEDTEDKVLSENGKYSERIIGEIEFNKVSLSYDGQVDALTDVSFSIKKGEKVGIVGRTGSGKSSTVALLARLYPHRSGEILVDGVNLSDYDRIALRRQIGFVSQDSVIFKGTIRDNLTCTLAESETISDSMLLKQAKKTGLYEYINKREELLDYKVLDNGLNLSQGEKQLINFTRIIIRDPSILILDEATSNTDTDTEKTIHEAVECVMSGRTTLIIAHRLSTIENCDKILVFNAGKLVEVGSHDDLKGTGGYYSELIKHQIAVEQH